jgi:DHA1 family multidrug resistance protein-like MFS transporter
MSTHTADSSRWQRTLIILFIGQMFTAAGFASFFPFLPFYVQDLGSAFNLNLSMLAGLTYSAQAFTMMLASPVWGALADRFGRKIMVERAMFGGAIILLLMAFVRSAEELILLRAVQGLVTGTIAAANALVAAVAPRHRMGFAMGMLQMGLGAGIALGPLLGGAIADNYGYSAAFYVTAGLLFFSGVLVWRFVDEHFEPPPHSAIRFASFTSSWGRVLRSQGVRVAYSMRFLNQLGRNMLFPAGPLLVQALMTDTTRLNTFTGLISGSAALTTTLSAIYFGRLGDRTGHRRIVILCSSAAVVLYVLHGLVTEAWQFLVLQALVGIALGGIMPSISALLANFTQSGDTGAVYGIDNSIDAGARSIAPMLGAAIAEWWGLRLPFAATALFFFLAVLMAARMLPRSEAAQAPAD